MGKIGDYVSGGLQSFFVTPDFDLIGFEDGIALPQARVADIGDVARGGGTGQSFRGDVAGAGAEAHSGILRAGEIGREHSACGADVSGFLIDRNFFRGGTAHRVGEDGRAIEQDEFSGADDVGAVGGGLTISLLEVDVAGFIERSPFAVGRKFGGELSGFDDLRRSRTDFSGDCGAAVALERIEVTSGSKLRDESIGVKSGGFVG